MLNKVLRQISFLLAFLLLANAAIIFAASVRAAVIEQTDGTVQIKKGGGEKKFKAFKGMNLSEGDTLITGADGTATVLLDDDKTIRIAPNTAINIKELKGLKGSETRTTIIQPKGVSVTKIDNKLTGSSAYNQKTPTAVMGVKGTIYSDEEKERGSTFAVVDGRTTVQSISGQSVTLTPGQQVSATNTGAGEPEVMDLQGAAPFAVAVYEEYIDDLSPQAAQQVQDYVQRNPGVLKAIQPPMTEQRPSIIYKEALPPSGGGGGGSGSGNGNTVTQSSNNNLDALLVSEGNLSPAFQANTTNYTISVNAFITSIRVTPTASDSKAAVKVNGLPVVSGNLSQAIPLNTGITTITIHVTAENGSLKTYTIVVMKANEPTVSFTTDSQTIPETAGAINANLTLSEAAAADVIVPFSIDADSTATAGIDYHMTTSSMITIPAGQTTGSILFLIADDGLSEGNETIRVVMGTPVNAAAGAIGTHTITIADDDGAPVVTEVSAATANGAYKAGNTIPIIVQFNKAVIVTGTPQLMLETGVVDRNAIYDGGSGSNTLSFIYTVQPGDTASDLDYKDSNALTLNGGTIKDTNANNANLTLPVAGTPASLAGNKNIIIDTMQPSGYSVIIDQEGINSSNQTVASFTFSGAEIGAEYAYTIDDSNNTDTAAVTGSGTIEQATQQITGIDVSGLADGTLTLTVYLKDTAGNQGIDVTVEVNKVTPPSGYSVAIDQELIDGSHQTAVSFTFSGAEIGAEYGYTIDDINNTETPSVTGSGMIEQATQQVTGIDVSGLADGEITLTAYLKDAEGNKGINVTATANKDAYPPSGYSVTINQSLIDDSNQTALPFTIADAEEGSTYTYSIDDSDAATTAVTGSGTITSETQQITGINVSSLTNGTLFLTVSLTDAAGNQGENVIDTVNKDVPWNGSFSVDINQTIIDISNQTALSFTISGAQIGAPYWYSIDDESAETPPVAGSGSITSAKEQSTGINVSGLANGTLTLTVSINWPGLPEMIEVTDTVGKNTQ